MSREIRSPGRCRARSSAAIQAAFFLSSSLPLPFVFGACAGGGAERGDVATVAVSPEASATLVHANRGAAIAGAPVAAHAAFSYVRPEWHDERVFKRVSEYFTGKENQGGDVVLRSTPEVRRGMYFQIGLPLWTDIPGGSTLQVEYRRGDSRDVFSHIFQLPAFRAHPFFEIRAGLTGPQWEGPAAADAPKPSPARKISKPQKKRLVAWRVTLRTPDGRVWESHSFLWELPPESRSAAPARPSRGDPAPPA
ncbi:MAG: hypothetical protein LBG65_08745 [Puniceicoccales bacterium]|jgi:hypothetical protein|nr:hypothetical protein [Puniceicoccales bacterium]